MPLLFSSIFQPSQSFGFKKIEKPPYTERFSIFIYSMDGRIVMIPGQKIQTTIKPISSHR